MSRLADYLSEQTEQTDVATDTFQPLTLRAICVVEQHLGHYTYYQNLRRFLEPDSRLECRWVEVTYREPGGLWEHVPLLSKELRGTLRGRFEIRRALVDSWGDVAFFNTQVPAAIVNALAHRRPYVVATDITPRQYDRMSQLYQHQPDRLAPIKYYKHMINVATFRHASRVLPWSNWARESLINEYGVAPERIEVVPPGVDLERWTPGTTKPAGPLRLLFVGGDFWRKGGRVLLEVFRRLPRGSAELHLVTHSEIAPEEGVFVYSNLAPNSPELLELYRNSQIFLLPSEAEAFGIAAAEAIATGLPVIASAIGGMADIVVDGENGFLISVGDAQALYERLQFLINDPAARERMGRAAREHAELHFDARHNAERVAAALLDALGRPLHASALSDATT